MQRLDVSLILTMYIRFIFYLFIIFFLSVIQIGFISSLPGGFHGIYLFLVIMVFMLGFSGIKKSLLFSMGMGFFLDIYSFYPFGIYLFSIFITVILSDFLLNNFFTNRSLYSFLALTVFSYISFLLCLNIFLSFFYFLIKEGWIMPFGLDFFIKQGSGLFFNILLAFCFFYIFTFFSKKFKPVFLDTKRL